ncbi:SatD family protein [Dermacoccaceae bacterium W4C1]
MVESEQATVIGDLVGSRAATDRAQLHASYRAALTEVAEQVPHLDPPRILSGDEFQARYATVGDALHAALLIRLRLAPETDIRFGVGWGTVTVLDPTAHIEDGPGWWAARAAIEQTEQLQSRAATATIRTSYRRAAELDPGIDEDQPERPTQAGPAAGAVNAALWCRDHLLGSLDERSIRTVRALMDGTAQNAIATQEGISASAVSQRVRAGGLEIIVAASHELRTLR